MNKTLEKVAAMSMVAAAMVATSCGTQKKAASENTNVSDAVVAYPDEAHDMDESYLILDDTQRAQVQKNNAFALKLFTETANMQSTVISPLSVTYLMAMLANGADGETRQQIMSTIGANDADINAMNALYHSIMEKQSRLDKATDINVANYIAVNKNIKLNDAFTKAMKELYLSGVESLDFASPKTAKTINSWCNKQTKGMIPSIIDNTDPNATAYLMNAIFFNGTWAKTFDKTMTKQERFQGYTRNIQKVQMMHQNDKFFYTTTPAYAAVDLPYGNGAYSMTVLLPHNGHSIDEIMKDLSAEKLLQTDQNMTEHIVDLKLPRFSIEQETSLNSIIAKLGAPSIFDASKANFSHMTAAPMHISNMLQKAKIEVNEKGTKAAAVTAAIMTMSLAPEEPQHVEFHATRPFVYIIKERATGAIFFIGQFTGAE